MKGVDVTGCGETGDSSSGNDIPPLPRLRISSSLRLYFSCLTEEPSCEDPSCSAVPSRRAFDGMEGSSSWTAEHGRFTSNRIEDDMAALAEKIATSMLDDDAMSSTSGSDNYNWSASTSEDGSPKCWTPCSKGFCTDSRPTSPAWSSSSGEYECSQDNPSVSCNAGDIWGRTQRNLRSPDSVLPAERSTPFQRPPLSHQELCSLQQQLESLSAKQLQLLKQHLSESQQQRARQGRPREAHSGRQSHGKLENPCRGLKEQARKQAADRRAISALANQQPNERLAPESRASRKNVVCGPRAIPQTVSKPVRPPAAKEGGTGVFLPLGAMTSAPAATSSKPGTSSAHANRRLGPNLASKPFDPVTTPSRRMATVRRNQVVNPPAHQVPVVNCSEVVNKIPVVSFNQRSAAQVAHPPRNQPPSRAPSQFSRSRGRPAELDVPQKRNYYGSYNNYAPQFYNNYAPEQMQAQNGLGRIDNLGLPEEWIY